MKQIVVVCCLLIFLTPNLAFAVPQELLDELPEEVQEIWNSADEEPQSTFRNGLRMLGQKASVYLSDAIKEGLRGVILLIVTVIICSMAEAGYQASGSEKIPNYISLAGTLTITVLATGDIQTLIGLGRETIEQLHTLSESILPAMTAALTASGGVTSAPMRQVTTILFCNLLILIIDQLFLPVLSLLILLYGVDSTLKNHKFRAIAEGIRKIILWVLTGILLLFTGYLSVSGAVTGSVDQLAAQLTRNAISTAVPVVGGIISDATESVLSSAALLKNSIGILGLFAVLAICLIPFLRLGVQFLLYKFAALLAGIFGDLLTDYINALSSVFGLLLGMTGTCALLLVISISSSVAVVIT